MKVTILGTEYTVIKKKYDQERLFKKRSIDGYCDDQLKEIVYCDMSTYPHFGNEAKDYVAECEKHTLRHG
ncbi:MAG: hypothetical protein RR562_10145 [Longicatena sp.]